MFDIVFVAAMLVLFAVFAALLVWQPYGDQLAIFFRKTEDFFADYFNPAKMSFDRNPYWFGLDDPAPQEHGYPPLAYFIFYFLSRFADYSHLSAFEAGYTTTGLASAFLFMTLVTVCFFALLRHAYEKQGVLGVLLPVCLFISSVFLFSFERGNNIILAVACATFFVLACRSRNKVVFELGLVALAVATALKGYPALFGMLLLFDRRFAAAVRCAVYAILLIFLPFLFFEGGLANVPIWLHNISLNSEYYASAATYFGPGLFRKVLAFIAPELAQSAAVATALDVVFKICSVACLLTSYFFKQHWKRVLALGLAIVCLQTNSAEYLGLYLFIGIVLFFNEKRHRPTDWAFLVLFLVFLNPVQVIAPIGVNLTAIKMGAAVNIMLIWLAIEGIAAAVRRARLGQRGTPPVQDAN